jgi:ankyrin repeat protein
MNMNNYLLLTLAFALTFSGGVVATDEPADGVPADGVTTELYEAARNGDVELVKKLLAEGGDVDAVDHKRRTALHIAAYKGYCEVVKELLAYGADVRVVDGYGLTALHVAARQGHVKAAEIVKELLVAGADVHAVTFCRMTVLEGAKMYKCPAVVSLIEQAIAEHARWSAGRAAWVGAVMRAANQEQPTHRK